MNIALFTLDEPNFIPASVLVLAEALGTRISCILAFPPPRRGSALAAAARWVLFLGLRGTWVFAGRRLAACWSRWTGAAARQRGSLAAIGRHYGIPVYALRRGARTDFATLLDRHPADLLVSVSCPRIIGREIRARFPRGAINVHSAPLPRYRGQMPTFWVLARGETTTAVTVHVIDDALDAGDILVQREIPIGAGESWDALLRRTKIAGAHAVLEALRQLEAGTVEPRPNRNSEATSFGFPTWRDARRFRARGGRMV